MLRNLFAAVFFITCLSTPNAFALQQITGAFGLELGGLFIPSAMATGKGQMTDGTPIYYFKPTTPYNQLSTYYVKITPTTSKIYEIVGEHEFDYSSECDKQLEKLAGLLRSKYGRVDKNDFMSTLYTVEQDARRITASCSMFDPQLRLTYEDKNLSGQAISEAVEIADKKGDASGL